MNKLPVKSAMNRKKNQKDLLPCCVYVLISKAFIIKMMSLFQSTYNQLLLINLYLFSSPVLSNYVHSKGRGGLTQKNLSIRQKVIFLYWIKKVIFNLKSYLNSCKEQVLQVNYRIFKVRNLTYFSFYLLYP